MGLSSPLNRARRADPLSFTYNLNRGARRWRDSLGRVRDGKFGIDIIVLGDSTSTYGDIYSSWPSHLRNALQDHFNDPSVEGGFGFFPVRTQNSGSNDWTISNGTQTWSISHNSTGDPAAGLVNVKIDTTPAADNEIYRRFNGSGSDARRHRQKLTDVQYVGLGYNGFWHTLTFDAGTDVPPYAGSNAIVTADPGGGELYGEHWTPVTGLTPTDDNYVQIATVGAANGRVRASGVICYNGDYNEGVRLHNLSSVGSYTSIWALMDGAPNAELSLQANIDRWTTGANGGAKNGKLFLINSMLNDCGASAETVTVAQYKTNLQTMITRAVARASKPCVGLIVNQPWGYNTSDVAVATAGRLAAYSQYRDACYQLADENPDTVFVIDFWKDLTYTGYSEYAPHGGDASVGGSLTDRGWYNDGTHLLDVGNFARARMLFAVLSHGVG